jgi:tripartite-type tricarboxylate transporter receptor subunit TctC
MAPIAGRLPHVRSGRLRALATGGPTRLPALPGVPTIAESGYPAYSSVGWAGIYVPDGTPQAVIDRLNAAIVTAVTLPAVKEAFAAQGVEGASSTPAEAAKLLVQDYARLGELARSIGMQAQ